MRDRLHRHWRSTQNETGNISAEQYEDVEFHVSILVSRIASENAYGIICKRTGEFGVYTQFVGDDEKKYENYYRSDERFLE
jgi:hypothetical protein